jgi:hypothetical protein
VTHLAREAQDAAAAAAWAAERQKPEGKRHYFGFDEIAIALARRPGRLEVDGAEHKRILRDLADWVRRGKFGAFDVALLGGDPADFVPLAPLIPGEILVTPYTLIRRRSAIPKGPFGIIHMGTPSETLFLRARAARQYVENSTLDGAARLMREWFPEAVAPSPAPSVEPVPADMVERKSLTHLESGPTPTRPGTWRPKASDAEVQKWYEGTYIPERQAADEQPSEDKDWTAAKLKFGHKVRRDQIRSVRRFLAPTDWRKQGRRTSAKNSAE